LRTVLITTIAASVLSIFAGCESISSANKKLLSVDFQKGQTLRYKFTSARDIDIDWGEPSKNFPNADKKQKTDSVKETSEIVMAYSPVDIDPYGLTTIKATCESVMAERRSFTGRQDDRRDALESLLGKSYTFKIGPDGKIRDYSELDKMAKQMGQNAFRPNSNIKEADMIDDFITAQWFLWDSIASIPNAAEGVAAGQTWKSKLLVPTPMLLRKARAVTYKLDKIRQDENGTVAVIKSSYVLSETTPTGWHLPYSGSFRMSGVFGFLINYKALDLEGEGEEIFNIDAGRTEQYSQKYQMHLEASLILPIGSTPKLTIKQELTAKLVE